MRLILDVKRLDKMNLFSVIFFKLKQIFSYSFLTLKTLLRSKEFYSDSSQGSKKNSWPGFIVVMVKYLKESARYVVAVSNRFF